jgi:hypothetical protein
MALSRTWKRVAMVAGAVVLVLALIAGGFVWWALTPLGPDDTALAALESDDIVQVTETESAWVFVPADDEPRVGFVLYPGGRVDPRSYAPLAREIAERGYLVAITPMPLNLAVLDADAAQGVINAHPDIMAWTIGGHSLGGTMAARFANANRDTIEGLALMASYPAGGDDMSDAELPAVSIYGDRDGILNADNFTEAIPLLPSGTRFVDIEGGNHAQFGSYGPQPGDLDAAIPPEDQRWETLQAIGEMLLPLRRATR